MRKIVVLVSGNGSNLQAIIDACEHQSLENTRVALVVSNRKAAYALERAQLANIPTLYFPLQPFLTAPSDDNNAKAVHNKRARYDAALADAIKSALSGIEPDLIVLAGWMHILTAEFLNKFPDKVINLHPALPGAFDGANAITRALEAFKRNEIKHTGVMVHYVIPAVDRGKVIVITKVPINQKDTLADLELRIHNVEHTLLIDGIRLVLGYC